MNRTERPYLRILILLLMAVVAALAAYLTMAQRMADPDQFWHIATGRWIVEHGAVPTMDVFSWWGIANGREWVAQSWLFGVLIYGVHSLGGFAAVYWAAGVLEALAVFVVYALARARRVDPLVALLVTVASMFGTMFFVAPRPQMLSFVLVPLTALLLEKKKWPLALAVMLLGVNVHGGIWPLYFLVFLFYEFPRRWWICALALALVGVNPNPINTFMYPLRGLLSTSDPIITEFMPTVLWTRKGDLAMYVALVLLTRRKRIPWKDGLLALAFVLLSLSAIRHVQWFYLIVLPILAPYVSLSLNLSAVRLPQRLADRFPPRLASLLSGADIDAARPERVVKSGSASCEPATDGSNDPRGPLGRRGLRRLEFVLATALTVASLLLGGAVSRQKLDVDQWYPKDMVAFLKLHDAKRLFNVWHEGGYLIFNGIQPLIDGRGDPFAAQNPGQQDLVTDYVSASQLAVDPLPLIRGA
jgi:hypothetical protein